MKKVLTLVLAVLMLVTCVAAFSACSKTNDDFVAVDAADLLQEDFGIAVKKNSPELLAAVNTVVDEWVANGTMTKYVEYYTALADYAEKGGTAPVEDVLGYGQPVRMRGLSLLQAPGNDLVASGALMASGAQMVLFTTGRGTPFGCPVPTVKISSNTALATRKPAWIDFDAGVLLSGTDMETLTEAFLNYVLDLASGLVSAKAEALDRHDLAIFKDGVTL